MWTKVEVLLRKFLPARFLLLCWFGRGGWKKRKGTNQPTDQLTQATNGKQSAPSFPLSVLALQELSWFSFFSYSRRLSKHLFVTRILFFLALTSRLMLQHKTSKPTCLERKIEEISPGSSRSRRQKCPQRGSPNAIWGRRSARSLCSPQTFWTAH